MLRTKLKQHYTSIEIHEDEQHIWDKEGTYIQYFKIKNKKNYSGADKSRFSALIKQASTNTETLGNNHKVLNKQHKMNYVDQLLC